MSADDLGPAYYEGSLLSGGRKLDVFRYDSGWKVRDGERVGSSRYLDEALERALGRRLDREEVRSVIEMLDAELLARREGAKRPPRRSTDPSDAVLAALRDGAAEPAARAPAHEP